jgi:nucleoside-diphosphate-sugar epimerase
MILLVHLQILKKIKKLKWKPQVDLDLGIKKTLKFLKN